jgi:hypothetical protein
VTETLPEGPSGPVVAVCNKRGGKKGKSPHVLVRAAEGQVALVIRHALGYGDRLSSVWSVVPVQGDEVLSLIASCPCRKEFLIVSVQELWRSYMEGRLVVLEPWGATVELREHRRHPC